MERSETVRAARILVVEDEALIAEDIRSQLVRLNHKVLGVAKSGIEAVQLAEALCPDLVMMDVALRGSMDGFEAASRISEVLGCPIVYVTSNPRASQMRYSIRKPFSEKALASLVASALSDARSDLL